MSAKIFRGICKQLVDPNKFKFFLTTTRSKSQDLREVIASKIPIEQKRIVEFRKAHGKDVIGNVTVNSMYGGMRGVLGFVYETSLLDSDVGIRFRGLSIPDLQEKLPKIDGGEEVQPEGVFWLLMTGEVPTKEQVNAVTDEWNDRGALPKHIISMLKNFPKTLHPMAQLSCAVVALNEESKFAKGYANRMARTEYWQCAYEDSMDLIAKVTSVAAHIYVNLYKNGKGDFKIDPSDDWTGNFCKMLGYNDPCFTECMRMYLTIHCDHEGGNVSAHAVGLVGSALSDPYLSFAAGMCGLAGPLHGLANQEVLVWLTNMQKIVGENPTKEKIKEFVEQTLKSGQVVPGFGHAVLRVTDPRYTCQREFAMKHLPDYPMFKLVSDIFEVVPPVLKATGKVQNPWPNVDAHSGVLLQYYGMKEMQYYTVLFGVSRAIGVLASLIWNRALGIPLERPKTLTTDALMKMVKDKKK